MSLDLWLYVEVDTGYRGTDAPQWSSEGVNITHNLAPMWRLAGVYDALYNAQGEVAGGHIATLRKGLAHMEDNPSEYRPLNPPNGWGSYEIALAWLRSWIGICVMHPKARIGVSR